MLMAVLIHGFAGNAAMAQDPPAVELPAAALPASDAEAIVEQFIAALRLQQIPYLKEASYSTLREELEDVLEQHSPEKLSKVQRRRLLTGIATTVRRDFDPADGDRLYLEFRDRLETFKWKLGVILARPVLEPQELEQRDKQRRWMRAEIESLPELPEQNLRHGSALTTLEYLLEDPLNPLCHLPMTEEDFARMQLVYRERTATFEQRMRLSIAPHFIFHAIVEASLETLKKEWPADTHGWGMTNLQWHLKFTDDDNNKVFFLRDVAAHVQSVYLDVARNAYLREEAPQSMKDRDRWLEQQNAGDVAFDVKADLLVGVRGARMAILDANDWYSADQVNIQELRALLAAKGEAAVPLASFFEANEPAAGMGRSQKMPAPSLAVQSADGTVAVIRFVAISNDGLMLSSRRRPLPANPPLHDGESEPIDNDQ